MPDLRLPTPWMPRTAALAVLVFFVTACGDDAPMPTAPDSATSAAETAGEPADGSETRSSDEKGADEETFALEVCKYRVGTQDLPADWVWSFDWAVDGDEDRQGTLEIVGQGCKTLDQGFAEGELVVVTEDVPSGFELAQTSRLGIDGTRETVDDPETASVELVAGTHKQVKFGNRVRSGEPERFPLQVCKAWAGDGAGPARSWEFGWALNGEVQEPFEVSGFGCVVLGEDFTEDDEVTVGEIVPDGFELAYVSVFSRDGSVRTVEDPDGPRVQVRPGTHKQVEFGNRDVEMNGGGEGCTPGFWRQPHHYEFWTGVTPETLWFDVFDVPEDNGDDSAGGRGGPPAGAGGGGARSTAGEIDDEIELGDAVQLQGGGLNALARHAVAAYLNASSPDVDYDLTPEEVVELVNDAIESGDYNTAKDILEAFNEQGCDVKGD